MKAKNVSELLSMLPHSLLEQIGHSTDVDRNVSRLRGELMVKLLIFGMLRSNRLSTRVLEHFYNSELFRAFSGKGGHTTRHSSLADRLSSMNADYFAELFGWASSRFARLLPGNTLSRRIHRVDSTMCSISSALVAWGMRVGSPPKEGPAKVQVKFTVGLRHLLPTSLESFFDQQYLSEEQALKQAIRAAAPPPEELVVFDLGLKSRKTLQVFDQERVHFVTKGAGNLRYQPVGTHSQIKGRKADGLTFIQDSRVHLYSDGHHLLEHPFRLVQAQLEASGEHICFLSNVWELSAPDIARVYRARWDIETFFRFIKQELNIKHLINHSKNGVKIQLYVALITAILVMAYKVTNQINSFKLAKLQFEEELLLLLVPLIQDKSPPTGKRTALKHPLSNT